VARPRQLHPTRSSPIRRRTKLTAELARGEAIRKPGETGMTRPRPTGLLRAGRSQKISPTPNPIMMGDQTQSATSTQNTSSR
jgi:hypothetical protein